MSEPIDRGTCPKCNGTKRIPCPPALLRYNLYGLNREDKTLPCDNCGGQYMYAGPTGEVRFRLDGTPCLHEYKGSRTGNCLHTYVCAHCGDTYEIDSGD